MAHQEGFTGFNMDEDYEDGVLDENGYFSFGSMKQKKKRFTKDEEIYGVFLGDDYDNQDKQNEDALDMSYKAMNGLQQGFRKSGIVQHDKRKTVSVNYFNKGGKDNSSGEEDQEQEEKEEEKLQEDLSRKRKYSQDTDEDEDEQVIMSKEQKRLKREFDFKKQAAQRQSNISYQKQKEYDEEQQLFYMGLPTQLGQKKTTFQKEKEKEIKQQKVQKEKLSKKEQEKKEIFGKGFDILKKLGYKEGKGMGKNEDGINKAIEAVHKQSFTRRDNQYNSNRFNEDKDRKNRKKLNNFAGLDQEEDEDQDLKQENKQYEIEVEKKWQKKDNKGKKQQKVKNKEHAFQFLMQGNKHKKQQRQQQGININNQDQVLQKIDTQKYLEQKGISNEYNGNNNNGGYKIIDMRGSNQQQISNISRQGTKQLEVQSGYSAKFLQKVREGSQKSLKNILMLGRERMQVLQSSINELQRKIKGEEDKNITCEYENKQIEEKNFKVQNKVEGEEFLRVKLKEFQERVNNKNKNNNNSVEMGIEEFNLMFREMFEESRKLFLEFSLEKLYVKYFCQVFKRDIDSYLQEEEQGQQQQLEKGNNNEQKQKQQLFRAFKKLLPLFGEGKEFLHSVYLFRENCKLSQYDTYLNDDQIHIIQNKTLEDKKPLKHSLDYLTQKCILPYIRQFMNSYYNPVEDLGLIDFFIDYQEIISQDLQMDLFENLVIPKLQYFIKKELNDVGSLNGKRSVDLWVVPWFELFTIEMAVEISKGVLQKLALVFQKYSALKNSQVLYEYVKPWKKQFEIMNEGQVYDSFLIRSVVPKLMFALNSIDINPQEQNIEDLKIVKKVLQYVNILNEEQIMILLEESILMKIGDILKEWMGQEQEYDKNEIKQWLDQWKQLLGISVMRIGVFQNYFNVFYRKAGISIK